MDRIISSNPEKRIVAVILSDKAHGLKFVGRARCRETDKFEQKVGERIALARANIKAKAQDIKELRHLERLLERDLQYVRAEILKQEEKVKKIAVDLEEFMQTL